MAQSSDFEQAPALLMPIGEKDVKFLAAGQKIDDIETAIRELVENSIDAESTNIEIGLTKFGVDIIEVRDNGTGIDRANFDKLAVRYHTSKVKDYKNFHESLQTYGFRGEALSCLCNISNVTIITKSRFDSTGSRLTHKKDGTFAIVPVARDVGTTVIVRNLFHSMPVRRRELEKTAKKQYDKVVRMLYEQVLARPHIMFSLSKKCGTRLDKDFTHGGKGKTLEDCLITIFGIKIMDTLMAFNPPGSNYPTPGTTENEPMSNGTETPEDQTKPQDDDDGLNASTQVALNQSQLVDASSADEIDVSQTSCSANSTQSMRQLQLVPVSQVSSKFYRRRSATSKYAREPVDYSISGYISKIGCGRNSTDGQYTFVNRKPCEIVKVARVINEVYRSFNQNQRFPFYCLFITVQHFATDFNVPRKRAVILQDEGKLCELVRETLERMYSASVPASQKCCPVAQIPFARPASMPTVNSEDKEIPMDIGEGLCKSEIEEQSEKIELPIKEDLQKPVTIAQQVRDSASHSPQRSLGLTIDDVADSIPDLYEVAPKRARRTETTDRQGPLREHLTNNKSLPGFRWSSELVSDKETSRMDKATANYRDAAGTSADDSEIHYQSPERRRKTPILPIASRPPPCKFRQEEILMDGSIKVYLNNCQDLASAIECDRIDRCPTQDNKEFFFAIDPKFNDPAEDQLKLNLNKTSFTEMEVIGQFNCGFILTKLNKHIFIIDQHATDERANYEQQLEDSPMVKQRMAHPKPLYLNLIQENAVIDNMEAFKKRGFEFLVDTTKTVGYRVMLSATSICKETLRTEHLGKEDIQELVDVVIDSPRHLESYTLKKVKNVAASIACRRSVMVGDKLSWQQMIKIVRKMSDLKNPWVCAHNRPTIRHLMDTDWKVFDTRYQ